MLKKTVTAYFAFALFILSQKSVGQTGHPEMQPTANVPITAEQKKEHNDVSLKQKKLKKKLIQKAPAKEIGKAKAEVQTERVDANLEDAKQKLQEDEARKIQRK